MQSKTIVVPEALSPAMARYGVVSWAKKCGEQVHEGEHIATFTTKKRIGGRAGGEKSSFHTFSLTADKPGYIKTITNNLSPGKEFCTLVDEPMAMESKKKPLKLPGHTKW